MQHRLDTTSYAPRLGAVTLRQSIVVVPSKQQNAGCITRSAGLTSSPMVEQPPHALHVLATASLVISQRQVPFCLVNQLQAPC